MDVNQAIAVIDSILAPKSLNHIQIEIVRGAIAGSSYQQIVDATKVDTLASQQTRATEVETIDSGKYKVSYVKTTAAQLWQLLTQRLDRKVTKDNLAAVLRWYVKQSAARGGMDSHESGEDLSRREIQQSRVNFGLDGDFYGRTEEIITLTNWCVVERCRLILLVGMGGMGKTTLAAEIAAQLSSKFDRIIWRSLVNTPQIRILCSDLLEALSPPAVVDLPDSLGGQIELLITILRQDRCLLIFDNVESILAGQVQCGQYLANYDGYDRLFRAIGGLPHQSCAILTSREKPHTIARLEIVNPQLVKSMNIGGMAPTAAYELVQSHGCPQLSEWMWQEVHAHYDGNPLALKIATIAAVEMTGGGEKMLELYPLMKAGKLQFQSIDDSLTRQFDRLSEIEQQLVYWLAIAREPITSIELRANLVIQPHAPGEIINALQSLARRCITIGSNSARDRLHQRKWSIQPVMIAYVTRRLIDRFVAELAPESSINSPIPDLQDRFFHLNHYPIIQPQPQDGILQTQRQFIFQPTIERLIATWSHPADLSQYLYQISTQWQGLDPLPTGYLGSNLVNLLTELSLK
ncbi:MAG: AAA family ATPase [Chamaesiphon sp.]|nr:AAA family ATPase [Chamaesiphon sp.]